MQDFEFDEFLPSKDVYEVVHHVIRADELSFFHVQRRFGPSWWIFSVSEGVDKLIGQIGYCDLIRFLKWEKKLQIKGSRIVKFSAASHSIDLARELSTLFSYV